MLSSGHALFRRPSPCHTGTRCAGPRLLGDSGRDAETHPAARPSRLGTSLGTLVAKARRRGQLSVVGRLSAGAGREPVLRFVTFGSARAAVRYFVEHGADCARETGDLGGALASAMAPASAEAARAVDYYAEGRSADGVWAGAGAAALGLTGQIRGPQVRTLERLLDGRLPDGTTVARPVWRPDPAGRLPAGPLLIAIAQRAAERGMPVGQLLGSDAARAGHTRLTGRVESGPRASVDARAVVSLANAAGVDVRAIYGADRIDAALARAGRRVDVRRAGADGQVSPPKSVSLLWAFGDPQVRDQVLAAHRAAVAETVAYLDRWAGHGLRGHQGDGRRAATIRTDGLVVAAFEHLTSRADDPQLHTHLVIANLVHGADGQWSALDTRALFRHQRTAGYLYQAVLRGELTRRLGVDWTSVSRGVAEVVGVGRALVREFSTRRRQIEAELDATGKSGVRAAQAACLATRPAKTHRTVADLAADWSARATAIVGDPGRLMASVVGLARPRPLANIDIDALASQVVGPDGITARDTGFDRAELTRHLLEHLPAGTTVSHPQVEALVDRLLGHHDVLPLLTGSPDGARRYTTRGLAVTEGRAQALARRPSAVPARPCGPLPAGLSAKQARMVRALVLSPATIDVVLGPAGSGKTAGLAAAAEHWARLGVPVLGAAVAAVAARRLEAATAIPATSLARLLHRVEHGRPLDRCTVVVLDEAGMVGTRDYHRLLTAVAAARGKLVAVGDRSQLVEIDAGGTFAALARTHLRAELTENHRQAVPWQQRALTDLRDGDVRAALGAYQRRGHLHLAADPDQLRANIAEQYAAARTTSADPFAVVALAATRQGAAALNRAIRERLRRDGSLPESETTLAGPDDHELSVAVGDLVLVTRNDHHRELLNGTRAVITDIGNRRVGMALDDGRTVTVPTGWAAERITHAYALTLHKAQGLTIDVALVDTSALPDRNAGYVALSRARHRTELHLSDPDALDDALNDDPFTQRTPSTREARAELDARLQPISAHQRAIDDMHGVHRNPPDRATGRGQ